MKTTPLWRLATGMVLAALLATGINAAAFAKTVEYSAETFSDVAETEWYADSVSSTYELGLMQGAADGTFAPGDTMTVAEAVTIASRVHDAYYAKNTSFNTAGANWYDAYVSYAVQNDIIQNGDFDSYDRPIKRHEMASVFASAVPEEFLTAKNTVTEIPDVPETNAYYPKLALLYNAGVVMGNDDYGTFMPDNDITRAEAAAVITRVALPENRLKKTLIDANFDDAYYLVNDFEPHFGNANARGELPWNYDDRNRIGVISNNVPQLADYQENNKTIEIWRELDNVSRGLVGVRFYAGIQLIGDGYSFRLTDDDKNDILSLNVKNGNWYINDTDTGRAAKRETLYFTIEADLDHDTAVLVMNGEQIGGSYPIHDGTVGRVYMTSPGESVAAVNLIRLDIYKDYLVNELFLMPEGTALTGWEVSGGSSSVAYTGGQTYNDYNSAKMTNGAIAKKSFRPIRGNVIFETYMLFPNTGDTGYVSLNSGDVPVAMLLLDDDGVFAADGTKLRHHTHNIWQCLRIEADTTTGKVLYRVNGKKVGEMSLDAALPTVDNITIGVTGGTAYFDDVTVSLAHKYDDYCPTPVPITDDGYDVIMNVCSLWREGSHSGWGCESGIPDIEPALGYYDEGIIEVADWEIKFMVENGIDVQHFCWYCPAANINEPMKRTNLNWALHDGYFNAEYSDMMKFTFMWENSGVNCRNLEQFKKYIWSYWMDYYFLDDRFYTIDNKLVFTVWSYHNFVSAFGSNEKCLEALEFMNEDAKAHGFDGVMFFFADGHNKQEWLFESMAGAGASASYAYHWQQDGIYADKTIARMQRNHDYNKIHIIPTVSVGFNNIGWSDVRKPLATLEDHRTVLEYIRDDYLPKQTGWQTNTLIVSTWNEYGEGTYVMPCEGHVGFGYLENIAEVISGVTDHSNNIYPTEQQKARLCHLYPETKTSMKRWDFEDTSIPSIQPDIALYAAKGSDLQAVFGLSEAQISGDVFVGATTQNDSGITVKNTKKPNIAAKDALAIRLTCKSSVNSASEIFFATDTMPLNGDAAFTFAVEASSDFKEYVIYTNGNDLWNGTITDLRLDVLTKPGEFEVRSVELLGVSEDKKPVEIWVNGKEYDSTFLTERRGGEYYNAVEPVKGFFSLHNFYYEWSVKTGVLYMLTPNDREIVFTVGKNTAVVDGNKTALKEAVTLRDGVPVLPLTFIYDIAGFHYEVADGIMNVRTTANDYLEEIRNRVPYEYEFNVPGDSEGFSGADGTLSVYDGAMHGISNARANQSPLYDPRYTLAGLNVPADKYNKIVVGMKHSLTSASTSHIEIFFITSADTGWNAAKSASGGAVKPRVSEDYIEYTFDYSNNAQWQGTITAIRLDPISCGGEYSIDYVRFVKDPNAPEDTLPGGASGYTFEIRNGNAEEHTNNTFGAGFDHTSIVKDDVTGSYVFHNKGGDLYSYSSQSVRFEGGKTYHVSADVRIMGSASGKTDITARLHANARYTDGDGKYDHVVFGKDFKPGDGWRHIEFSFTVPTGVLSHSNDQFCFYSNPAPGGAEGVSFRFDNVVVTVE